MRKRAAVLALVLVALPARDSGAHPMGNFSISHYAGIEIAPDTIRVKYLLDFAEIPAVRELELVDPDLDDRVTPEERAAYLEAKTGEVLRGLRLVVDGRALPLGAEWSRVSFPPGEGGLSTVRTAWLLSVPLDSSDRQPRFLVWNDANYEDRVGWKEIRFTGLDGVGIGRTSLRWSPQSDELSAYPDEYLSDPPVDTKAWCRFGVGLERDDTADIEPPPGFAGPSQSDNPFVRLVTASDLTPRVVLASLLLAAVLGAGHALEPGHGKTLVAAYLVGSHGTVLHAVLLGLIVTLTHTFSVFLLGAGVLYLSRYFVPEQMFPWLGAVSGALIVAVGVTMLRARWREGAHGHAHDHHHAHRHDHDHAGDPHHDHDHDHGDHHHHGHPHHPGTAAGGNASLRSILALGVSGGLVPCPAAIVVLLAAVALGRVGFGMVLIAAFSGGLAAVLVSVGTAFVLARGWIERLPRADALTRRLGLASAAVVTVFGVVIAVRSLTA
ncbi:MAG: nickel/cobalt transporter [Candidatus Eiseniibacteriota bacterium]